MSKEDLNIFKDAVDKLLPASYLQQGVEAISTRRKKIQILITERKWPKEGWDDLTIKMLLNELAGMDSNNFLSKSGVGEREGRVYSSLVAKRNFNLSHGIGRSGDLGEVQPKAVGSSLLNVLTNALVLDLCRTLVSPDVQEAFVAPVATGMSLALVLLQLKREKPNAKYVIWPRIDQKSCFKCIITAGLEPLIIEGSNRNGEIRTNITDINNSIETYGVENILCILTTTSCFSPRAMDSLEEVGKICKTKNIFHVVNNAYGFQSGKCLYSIQQTQKFGRLDIFVQSTDKNLMVPVGGAIIAGFDKAMVHRIRQNYPGRASSSQSLDVFITLLSMGSINYQKLLTMRRENYTYLKEVMSKFAEKNGEQVIHTPNNQISIGLTLGTLGKSLEKKQQASVLTELGSMLFHRNVCGSRVITCSETKTIDNFVFKGWGSHCSDYPFPYLTAAATIGMDKTDVDFFIKKLEQSLEKLKKKWKFNNNEETDKLDNLDIHDGPNANSEDI